MKLLVYLLSGALFGLGLSLAGMIDPQKVLAFLSVGQAHWDPSLLFVLGSATPVYLLAFLYLRRRTRNLSGAAFANPAARPIDRPLVLGSLIFGIGWGLKGLCPGPALAQLAYGGVASLIFVGAMLGGFELQRRSS
jgi:uncharacterized membrane protein YedE/YeeE